MVFTTSGIIISILIIAFFLAAISIGYFIYGVINSIKMYYHLKKNKVSRWKELYWPTKKEPLEHILYLRIWKYFYDNRDIDDKNILYLKKKLRKTLKHAIIAFILAFSVFLLAGFVIVAFG